jgi:peptidoglycan/LPS O-acetylase OafA/YrhL
MLAPRLKSLSVSKSSVATLPALTGARFLAASSVVVYHYGLGSIRAISPTLAECAGAGAAAVSFFYVLSGAVLTWGCTGQDGLSARTSRVFWIQRALRILPVYLLAITLSFAPFALHAWQVHPGAAGAIRIACGLAGGLLLIQALWPPLAEGLNTPGWSISCEAFFYALWPRLVGQLRTERKGLPWRRGLMLWAAGLTVPVLGIAALRAGVLPAGPLATLTDDVSGSEMFARTLSYFPPFRLPEFALGIVVGHALRCTPARPRSTALDTMCELGLACALIICAQALGSGLPGKLSGVPLADRIATESGALAPIFALTVWQLARGRGLMQRILAGRVLQLLGEASYALYILQEPVLVWTSALLKRSARGMAANWDLYFWFYAGLLVLLSLLVHQVVELPLRGRLAAKLAPARHRLEKRSSEAG